MKLKKLKKSRSSNLELQILKLYRKKKNFDPKTEIKLTEILLNKIANVIFLYHSTGKTILFLGFPTEFNTILKTTKHLIVPEFMWQTNMFNNTISFTDRNKKAKLPKSIFKLKTKLKKKVDLIIINNETKNKTEFKESYLAQIPTITLTKDQDTTKKRFSSNATGSYQVFAEKKNNQNFFFLFIKSVLLRAKKFNKKLLNKNSKLYSTKTIKYNNKFSIRK